MKTACAVAIACLFSSGLALAAPPAAGQLPTAGNVASGVVTITQNGNVMNVNQGSDKGIINWQTFSIGQGAQVNFIHPGSSSATLNRVISSEPSSIYGQLNANGQVYLINPNGIVIGPSGQINANGLVLSTSDITDVDFLAGNNTFAPVEGGSISVEGSIMTGAGGLLLNTSEVAVSDSATIEGDGLVHTFDIGGLGPAITTSAPAITILGTPRIAISDTTFTGGNLAFSNGVITNIGPIPVFPSAGPLMVSPVRAAMSNGAALQRGAINDLQAIDARFAKNSDVLQTGAASDGKVALGFNPVTLSLN